MYTTAQTFVNLGKTDRKLNRIPEWLLTNILYYTNEPISCVRDGPSFKLAK